MKYFIFYSKFDIFVQVFNDNLFKNELSVILSNFQCISDKITCLEKSGVNLGKNLLKMLKIN